MPTYAEVAAVYQKAFREHPVSDAIQSACGTQIRGNAETLLLPVLMASQPDVRTEEADEWLGTLKCQVDTFILNGSAGDEMKQDVFSLVRNLNDYIRSNKDSACLPGPADIKGWSRLLRECAKCIPNLASVQARVPSCRKAKTYKEFQEDRKPAVVATVDF